MRFSLSYNWYRFLGIAGLSLIAYIVVVDVFGQVDISGYLPISLAKSIQREWPDLPFFTVQKRTIDGGKAQEVYYTVPTRQLTAQEVAQLESGRKAAKPTAAPSPAAGR